MYATFSKKINFCLVHCSIHAYLLYECNDLVLCRAWMCTSANILFNLGFSQVEPTQWCIRVQAILKNHVLVILVNDRNVEMVCNFQDTSLTVHVRFSNRNLDTSKHHLSGGQFIRPMCKIIIHITIDTGLQLASCLRLLYLATLWRNPVFSWGSCSRCQLNLEKYTKNSTV